jgi:hypothetical protein
MRLSVKALAMTCAVLWGGSILFVGLINLAAPSYGITFLEVCSSIYPGFHASRSFGDVLSGTGYGLIDGAVGGYLFGWLYNLFNRPSQA